MCWAVTFCMYNIFKSASERATRVAHSYALLHIVMVLCTNKDTSIYSNSSIPHNSYYMIGANGVCSMATAGHYPQSSLPDAENMLSGCQVCD